MFLGRVQASFFRFWKRLSLVWKYQIVFWTFEAIGSFPVHFIGLWYVLRWQAPVHGIFFLKMVEFLGGLLITTGFAKILDGAWFSRKRAWSRAGLIVVITILILLIRSTIFIPLMIAPIYHHYGGFPRVADSGERKVKWIAAHSYYALLYPAWAGVFLLVKASAQSKKKERELHASELKRREAEILMLRSQLNPHFLFNAMSTIAYESEGNPKIDQLVEGISDYLRYSLSTRPYVPLGEEIEATRRYLEVQSIRLGTAMHFEIDTDPASHQALVPGIFLQTLVENALKYGGRGTPPPLRIRVVSRKAGSDLHVEVANTGDWVTPSPKVSGKPGGLGLENLKARLELFYPQRYEFGIRTENGWTTVSITLRYPESEEAGSAGLRTFTMES